MVSNNIQLVPGFGDLSQHLCSNTGEWDISMEAAGSFAHIDVISPLPNALKTRELLLS